MNLLDIPLFPLLPLGASSDWVGILIFIAVAFFSLLGKRNTQSSESEEELPTPRRRVPPRMPSPAPAKTTPPPDLVSEMRRFLEEVQRNKRSALPENPPQTPKTASSPSKHVEWKPMERPVPETRQVPVRHMFQPDAERSQPPPVVMSLAEEEQDYEPLKVTPSLAPIPSTNETPPFQFNRSLLTSASSLKQAVILSEILGKPRALTM